MSERTAREKVETRRGVKFIRLSSGRMISFWDAIGVIEAAHTTLVRGMSRAVKLAADDWDLERVEHRIDQFEEYLAVVRAHVTELRDEESTRERIKKLRNVAGRTPEEAAAFQRKADQLEQGLAK